MSFNAFRRPGRTIYSISHHTVVKTTLAAATLHSHKGREWKMEACPNLKEVNSKQLDYCPFVSSDGKVFFFTSEEARAAGPL